MIVILALLVLVIPFNSLAFQNEPDGFRGIKWGTKIETLTGMRKVEEAGSDIIRYTRSNDKFQIGSAKLKEISYLFWQGKFLIVSITTDGYFNWESLKEAVFAKFGVGNQKNPYIKSYSWLSGKVHMSLEYNNIKDEGWFIITSRDILYEKEIYDTQKAKEGSKDF